MMSTARDSLRKLAPVLGEARVNQLWRAFLLADGLEKRDLENLFEAYAAQALGDVPSGGAVGLFPPPPPERALGDIDLGYVRYAGKDSFLFGLRSEELLRHVGIYGSSGCGKSNAIALVLDGLTNEGIPFLICDFKRTFRSLLLDPHTEALVFTAGDSRTSPFKLNPLIPPAGTSVEVWAKKVIGALSHAFCQGAGSESLLVSALAGAYERAASERRWPTFRNVAEILERQPARGRKGMWMDSAQRAVTSISNGNAAEVFCPEQPTEMTSLLAKSVVLELDLLNQAEQTFLSEILILWIIQYRMNNNTDRETLKHVILIEEAHHLLRAPPGVGDGSEPVIHVALREVRELGESVILATQNASVVPVPVFGNQSTTLAFHTKHAKDVSSTAQGMLLKDEAKDELGRLPVGEAIVRIPRWPDAIHIRLKLRGIAKGKVSDEDIRRHMANRACSADTALFRPAEPQSESASPLPPAEDNQVNLTESPSTQAHSLRSEHASPTTTPGQENRKEAVHALTDLERAMLDDILKNPLDGVVKRIHRLNISRRKGTAALKALEAKGLVRPAVLFTKTSLVKLFDLTTEGLECCRQCRLGPLPAPTEGGVIHRYWVHDAASRLRAQGWVVETESRTNENIIVDVAARKDDVHLAVLVETGKSKVRDNIEKARQAGFEKIWVVSTNPKVRLDAQRLVETIPDPSGISFKTPDEVARD